MAYPIHVTTPGTYTLWLRGYPANAAGDSAYVSLASQLVDVTGFAPGEWSWATTTTGGITATLSITTGGVYTANLLMREDGLRIDRLLLTTDTTFIPTGFGPPETDRQLGSGGLATPLTRTIVYTYDNLYRLTDADYTSGENYRYSYDKVGNRLQQIIDGDTTTYQYDAANRLEQLNGQSVYTFDNNGNLLNSDTLTNTFDAANRLIETERAGSTLEPIYNGVNDRVGQTTSVTTTYFALDVQGLPEVIYTTEGNLYLHLPGVMMAESGTGEIRYLLSDGLGSVRQATDENGEVVAYNEFDPYGNPVQNDSSPYGFTGEWWESDVSLLHLRARWYAPETGTFLSRDPWEGDYTRPQLLNGWSYAEGNPINFTDSSGKCLDGDTACWDKAKEIVDKYSNVKINMGIHLGDACGYYLYILNKFWKKEELDTVEIALDWTFQAFDGNYTAFEKAFPEIMFVRRGQNFVVKVARGKELSGQMQVLPTSPKAVILYDILFSTSQDEAAGLIVHEMGHVLDYKDRWHGEWTIATGGQDPFLAYASSNTPAEHFADAFVLWVLSKSNTSLLGKLAEKTHGITAGEALVRFKTSIDYMENQIFASYQ